jgi:glycosyl transferase family 87
MVTAIIESSVPKGSTVSGKARMTSGDYGSVKQRLAGMFLLIMTLILAVNVVEYSPRLRRGYQDFTAFYGGAEMVRTGQAARLYDLKAQYQLQKQFAPDVPIRLSALPYNHPPFEVLIFLPFTYLSYLPAYLLWTFLNFAMLGLSLGLLRKTFAEVGGLSPVFVLLGATAFTPVVIALMHGQDSILLLLLITLSLISLEEGQDVAAGVALGLGLFKFQLALPLTLILAVKRPRLLLGFAPVAALLAILSVMLMGWRGATGYVPFVLHLEKTGAAGAISARGMANIRGLIFWLPGVHDGSVLALTLTIACSMAVLTIAMWQVRKPGVSVRFAFVVATVTTMLISYHLNPHDLTCLVPVVLLLFAAPVFSTPVVTTPVVAMQVSARPFATPGATRSGMRADVILLVSIYLLFFGSLLWAWISPWWCVPVLGWIYWKFPHGHAAEAVARS